MTPSAPLQRVSAAEVAFQALKTLIADDATQIGDRLPGEIDLAKRFGVSRSILREALGACATLGLTETRTGSGTFVLSKTEHPQLTFGGYSAQDLIEVRPHIEIPSAGLAAERHTDAQLDELRGYVDRMRETTDLRTWVKLDGQFHCAIAEASGNPVFAAMVESMRHALDPQSEFLNITKARRDASNAEHEQIFEAIASRGAQAAQDAVAAHIDAVARALAA